MFRSHAVWQGRPAEKGKTHPATGGRHEARLTSGGGPPRTSPAVNLLAGFFLVYVFLWNLTTVSAFTLPERLEPIGYSFGVAQSWSMFTPFPTREDGWFVIPGNLRDGQTVDLMPVTRNDFGAHPVSWEKPDYVAGMDKNDHWRKYLQSLRSEAYVDQRLHFFRSTSAASGTGATQAPNSSRPSRSPTCWR